MNASNIAIFLAVLGITALVGTTVVYNINQDLQEADFENKEYDVVSPNYAEDMYNIVLVLVVLLGLFGLAGQAANRQKSNHLPHPIDIYKRQYVDGHLALDEFEDKVYNAIEVEEFDPDGSEKTNLGDNDG